MKQKNKKRTKHMKKKVAKQKKVNKDESPTLPLPPPPPKVSVKVNELIIQLHEPNKEVEVTLRDLPFDDLLLVLQHFGLRRNRPCFSIPSLMGVM